MYHQPFNNNNNNAAFEYADPGDQQGVLQQDVRGNILKPITKSGEEWLKKAISSVRINYGKGDYIQFGQPIYRPYTKGNIFALDCQMVEACNGPIVVSVSVITEEGIQCYDKILHCDRKIPSSAIEKFGLTLEDIHASKVTLSQVQRDLKELFDKRSILICDGPQKVLNALRIKHDKVIDIGTAFLDKPEKEERLSIEQLLEKYLGGRSLESVYQNQLARAQAMMDLVNFRTKEFTD